MVCFFTVSFTTHHSILQSVCLHPIQLLLQNPLIWKYSVSIIGDISVLMKYMNVCPRSCFDIGYIGKTVHPEAWLAHDKKSLFHSPVGLQTLTEAYLQRKVNKLDWASVYTNHRSAGVTLTSLQINCFSDQRDSECCSAHVERLVRSRLDTFRLANSLQVNLNN